MAKYVGVARDSEGNIVSSPTVYISDGLKYLTTIATIYSDSSLTTVASNPITGKKNGSYSFFAPPGTYTLTVLKGADVLYGPLFFDVADPKEIVVLKAYQLKGSTEIGYSGSPGAMYSVVPHLGDGETWKINSAGFFWLGGSISNDITGEIYLSNTSGNRATDTKTVTPGEGAIHTVYSMLTPNIDALEIANNDFIGFDYTRTGTFAGLTGMQCFVELMKVPK